MTSDYDRCPKCNHFGWMASHQCWEFRVYHPDSHGDETDAATLWAVNPREAVERWVAQHESDCCEWPVASGRDVWTVRVRKPGEEWANYTVSGETVPSYRAEPAP